MAQLSERLARVTDAVRRRDEAEAVLEASRVDDALVARIEAAGIEVAKAEAAAATGAATITVRRHRRRRRGDRRSGRCAPRRNQPAAHGGRIHRSRSCPDCISVVVNAGAEAQALADRLAEARAAFRADLR